MKERLERELLVSVTLNSGDILWVKKGKEILMDGRLFDIKSLQFNGNSYTFTGLFDDEETTLVKKMKKQHENGNASTATNQAYIQLMQWLQSVFYDSQPLDTWLSQKQIFFCYSGSFSLPRLFKVVLTPPPQCA